MSAGAASIRGSTALATAESDDEEEFPHIYGPLNVDAVIETLSLDAQLDGRFYFPREYQPLI